MLYRFLREMAQPTDELRAMPLYHGTGSWSTVESIIHEGLKGRAVQGRSALAPVQGRVYLTPSLRYAAIYALGGDMFGHDSRPAQDEDQDFGYVLEFSGKDLQDVQPDEDSIGYAVMIAAKIKGGDTNSVKKYYSGNPLSVALLKAPRQAEYLYSFAQNHCTWNQLQKAEQGYVAQQAQIGKKLVRVLPESLQQWLIQNGAHIAHGGDQLKPIRVFKIAHQDVVKIKRDASNLKQFMQVCWERPALQEAHAGFVQGRGLPVHQIEIHREELRMKIRDLHEGVEQMLIRRTHTPQRLQEALDLAESETLAHPRILYHNVSKEYRASILAHGLMRKFSQTHLAAKEQGDLGPDGKPVHDDDPLGGIFFAEKNSVRQSEDIDTYAVDVSGIPLEVDLTTDPEDPDDHWWVTYDQDIPPERLRLFRNLGEQGWVLPDGSERRRGIATQAEPLTDARHQWDTPEFKHWFGNSQARRAPDSSRDTKPRNPLTLYHGSPGDIGDGFAPGHHGTTSSTFGSVKVARHGYFFSEDPEFAHSFAVQGERRGLSGGNITPVHLSVQNALWAGPEGVSNEDAEKLIAAGVDERWVRNYLGDPRSTWEAFDEDDGAEFVAKLKQCGYDGVRMEERDPETGNDYPVWVVFSPNQIKSAVGNRGRFDPSKPGLTEATYTVFHGTDEEFTQFDPSRMGSAHGTAPINMTGFNFTDSPEVARTFGDRMIKAKVRINRPLIINARGENYSEFKHVLNQKLDRLDPQKHDGVIIKNYKDAGNNHKGDYILSTHYIPLSTNQIQIVESEKEVLYHGSNEANLVHDFRGLQERQETLPFPYRNGKEFTVLIDPTAQEVVGFLRNRTHRGYGRIVIASQQVFVWDADVIIHGDGRFALEQAGLFDGNNYTDGVLSLRPDFDADPGMWSTSLPRREGPVWYEFDMAQRFPKGNQIWPMIKAGLERMPAPGDSVPERKPSPWAKPKPESKAKPELSAAELDELLAQLDVIPRRDKK